MKQKGVFSAYACSNSVFGGDHPRFVRTGAVAFEGTRCQPGIVIFELRATMFEHLEQYFDDTTPPAIFAAIAVGSGIEYVFPPFPGDALSLAAYVAAYRSGLSMVTAYLVSVAAATGAGIIPWRFGCWLRVHPERYPSFLKRDKNMGRLSMLQKKFSHRAWLYLLLNRFLPVSRALFFVAAGLSDVKLKGALIWGALSAALWNACLLALGSALGANLTAINLWLERYAYAMIAVLVVIGAIWYLRSREREA